MLDTILIVFAFVFFVVAATGRVPAPFNLVAAGLACWVATLLF